MKAYWLNEEGAQGDQISEDFLRSQGVHYEALSVDDFQVPLDALKSARGYVEQDQIGLAPDTPNLEAICNKFIDEHYHDEDEVRFVLEGDGIFDIRSSEDRWMRVVVEKGDLIVVPAKRHHRFFLTERKEIRCVRLFKDQAGWVPHYRAA